MGKLREKIAKADEKLQLNEEAFRPSGWVVAVVLIFLIAAMSTSIFLFEQHLHITMLICMGFTILLLVLDGCSYSKIEKAMLHGGLLVIPTLLVLFCIGALMGSWIASGTVPMIIYWGLKLINPAAFLATACIACMITSLATGSSWSTVGTVGVALMGVGLGLNINPAMTAGAVVSGAVFGDKMSPMSDTTNVAPAVAEADIFDHIKAMMFTGGPAIVIALIIYVIMGINHQGDVDSATIDAITSALKTGFHLNAWTLVPIVVVFVLAIKKVPAFPTLLISGLLAAVIALFAQGSGFVNILSVMENGFVSETGIAEIDKLLSRGGIFSMNYNVTLSVIVMVYGGLLEKCGILAVFLDKIKGLTKTVGTLVLTTVITEIA
ncbi:MAG: Na+/H+ antiporter NhaC family protein, partial [Eubacterium sp.]|nr:Na+/H+ antiporter NhaC family protein [Eubacterium sp.]